MNITIESIIPSPPFNYDRFGNDESGNDGNVQIEFDEVINTYEVSIQAPTWVTVEDQSVANNKLFFTLRVASTNSSRYDDIQIKLIDRALGEEQEWRFTINQTAPPIYKHEFNPYPKRFDIKFDGEILTSYYDVDSPDGPNRFIKNVDVIPATVPSWVTVDTSIPGYISFDVLGNPSRTERNANITFTSTAEDKASPETINKVIRIHQYGQGFISTEPTSFTLDFLAQTASGIYFLENLDENGVQCDSKPFWVESVTFNKEAHIFEIKVPQNNSNLTRRGAIVISSNYIGSTDRTSTIINITQDPWITEYVPSWKDTFFELNELEDNVEFINYRVELYGGKLENEIIFDGRAYANENSIRVNLREIWEDYVSSTSEIKRLSVFSDPYSAFDIRIIYNIDGGEEILYSTHFMVYYNYAYDREYINATLIYNVLNIPLQREFASGQYVPVSYLGFSQIGDYDIRVFDNQERPIQLIGKCTSNSITTAFIQPPLKEFGVGLTDETGGIFDIDLTYKGLENNCYKYVLYYQNCLGGWDYFIMKGKCYESFSTKNYEYDIDYINYTNDPGKTIYLKEKTDTYKLNTGYVTEEVSKRMFNILETRQAHLHNIETGVIDPVKITDTKFDIKTHKTNGRKLINYTINVESTQKQELR